MTATQDLLFGVTGQSLVCDCEDGTPSSVTSVAVYFASADDTSQERAATTGSPAIDAVSTTVITTAAGASALDPTLVTLNSLTGIVVDRFYTLTNTNGQSEIVDIAGKSSTAIYTRSPLKNEYPITTSTFKATRVTVSVDSTWVAALANLSAAFDPNPRYRVRWVVVIGGVTFVYDRYFDLVRYQTKHGVTPAEVERRLPGWLDSIQIDTERGQGRVLIDAAATEVKMDLWNDGKADTAIRNGEALGELVIARLPLQHLENQIRNGATVDATALKLAQDAYKKRYDGLLRAPFLAVDLGGGGGAATNNQPRNLVAR